MLIYLVRHGETDWNIDLKIQGKKDIPLNENGIAQANVLASFFEGNFIDFIYTSNLKRAYETARIIGQKLNINLIVLPELQEINMGRWEGNIWDDVKVEYSDFIFHWENNLENIPIPDGESYGQVQKRVLKAFSNIISSHSNDSKIIVVSHGIAIKLLISHIIGLNIQNTPKFSIDNASISIIEISGNQKSTTKLKCLNNTFHLQRLRNFNSKKP